MSLIYSQPDGAKMKHIAANDQVSLHFNCTPTGGDVVVLSGRATVVHGAPPPSQVPGLLDKYLGQIQSMGYTQEWYDAYNTAIRVTPERAWTIPTELSPVAELGANATYRLGAVPSAGSSVLR